MADERLNRLGKGIWKRVVRIVSLTETRHLKVVGPDCLKQRDDELRKLWADLQTLFRGGVFPENFWHPDDDDESLEDHDG